MAFENGVHDHDRFALDNDTANRTKNEDGHLTVKLSNFSKANVCPYQGKEIPDGAALGLDPEKIYYLYRDPSELRKGAPTLDNKPILSEHKIVLADSYPSEIIIGTVGEKTKFNDPYLQGSLTFWSGKGIEAVEGTEDGKPPEKPELSCGYRYEADMTPGKAPDGTPYDGVMRNIRFNHISIVPDGRAGADCVVGDSAEGLNRMKVTSGKLSPMGSAARGVIVAALHPIMAADAALDLKSVLGAVRKKSWAADKARIVAGLPALITGKGPKLATDAEVGPIVKQVEKLLDTINPAEEGMDDDPDMSGMDEAETDEEKKARMEKRAADRAALDAEEETPAEKEARMKKRAEDKAAHDAEKGGGGEESKVTKEAMDAALRKIATDSAAAIAKAQADAQAGTIATILAIDEAKIAVRPLVGDIAVPMSSPDMVFDHALKSAGHDVTGVNLAGKKALVVALAAAKSNPGRPTNPGMGLDAAGATNLAAFRQAHGLTARTVKRA